MDDPRVSGLFADLGGAWDVYADDVMVRQGPVELSNDEGSWTGTWSGSYEPTMGWRAQALLEGGGAEGLTFLMHSENDVQWDIEFPVEGVIFVGPPPIAEPAE